MKGYGKNMDDIKRRAISGKLGKKNFGGHFTKAKDAVVGRMMKKKGLPCR